MTHLEQLKKNYYDPVHPAGFSSAAKLYTAVNKKVKLCEIINWLKSQDTFTLHRNVRKNFIRNRYFVTNIDELWQCDLMVVSNLAVTNNDTNYLLTVIDVFSKFLWVIPLRRKSGIEIKQAFVEIFNLSGRRPKNIMFDKGREFLN